MPLLLVEDTEPLASSLARGLGEEGFDVVWAATGEAALSQVSRLGGPEAVILDLGLPDVDGLTVLEQLRASGYLGPILVLTARDAVKSRVAALDRGADDYVVKPFAFEELCARVRALLRRAASPRWAPLACGNLSLSTDSPDAHVAGRPVKLSPRQRDLLVVLLRRRGETVSRREILLEVFGYDFDPGTNVVDVHIAHVRRKLEGADARIETVRGAGYRLVPPREE